NTMKLIFCDTFHQEPPDGSVTSSWAIIEFPCAVVLEEIRIVPRGARVHDQLAGDTQRGQTNPPHFRIDFFACDVKNENASTFENLCAIEYHESSKTTALPRLPFLTKQLLCSGWYSSVTIAVFGAEGSDSASVKAIHERRDNLTRLSSRPPPTAPLVDDIRTSFQNMDSREFSRTTPLLPLPNILPQPGPVGDIPVNQSAGYQIEDEIYRNQVSLLHNSGNSSSFPQRGLHHDHPNYRYQRGNSRYADQDNYNNRRRFQGMNRAAQTEKHDADPTVEEEAKFVQDDAEHENQMQYEEISDDEMDEEANLRDMEAMMTADMLLPTSVMSFNPFDMEVFPLSHFRSPDLSDFEVIRNKLSQQICPIEFNGKHTAEICAGNEDQWVNNLEKITLALSNELPYLEMCNDNQVDYNVMLITWALYAMELNGPLSKHISLSVRALKVGLGMVKALSQTCSEIVEQLDKSNVFEAIFCMLLEKHVASSLKILALHTLDAVTNWPAMIDSFLFKPFSIAIKDENSLKLQTGYAWLIEIALEPQAARVVAGVTQLTKKVHLYECMHQVQVITQSVVNEKIPDEFAYISEEEEEYSNEEEESHLTPVESVIYMDDVTVNEEDLLKIAACLDEITACFQNPQQFFGRLSVLTFPFLMFLLPLSKDTNYGFRMAEGTNLLASIQALVSLPIVSGHKALFDSCGRFLESLISSHPGLLYLASNSDSTLHIIQHLMKSSLQLEVEDMNSPCNLGARLAFHLQTIQSLDLVSTLLESDADEEDIEEELAHAFKTLYSITYLPIGRQCVSRVLSKDDNLKSIITCLTYPNKIAEEEETQEKKPAVFHHRTAVNCYAGSLLLSLLQGSEDMAYIYRHQSDLTITCLSKRQLISHAEDIQNWLTPLQEQLTGDVTDIEKLVSFIKLRTSLLEWITFPESGPELCMTLRLLCYICLIDTDKDLKDDAESRVRVLSLFASDALNVLLSFMDQLQKCLQFACHGHRAMASGMTLTSHQMITSMTCRSYSLLQRMLSHLVGADIDSKIVNGERITLTVISLYSDLHLLLYPSDPNLLDTITEQAISIISIFFSPSSCSEKFLSTEMQYKVLKQVTTFAESQCDNFLPTLTLLSQLLPLPLPIIVPEDPPQQAQAIVVATCRLWSSTIPSHVDDIMALLLPLSSSTCRPLVELTIIIVQQLADLSSTLANLLVKKYIEEMIPLSVSANGEKEMLLSPEQITVIQTFAEIISLPAAKTAFLCACHSEQQGVLDLWQYATNEESPADAVAAILLLAYVLVDEETSLLPFDYTLQSYANALPAVDQIEAIVTLALSQLLNISPRVYNRALLVLLTVTRYLFYSIGFPYVVKHILAKSDNLRKAINGICDGFDVNQPKSVDAVFHLLQFVHSLLTPQLDNGPNEKFTLAQFKSLISSDEKTVVQAFVNLENKLGELICEEQNFSAQYALALDQYSSLRQSLCIVDISTTETQVPEFASLPEPTPLNEQFIGRPMFAYGNHDAILATRQALTAPPSQQLNLDNQDDYRVVECDLIATAENFCPGYDLAEQVNKLAKSSGLQDEVEESEAAAAARAKRRQKVEAFSARFGKTMNFIKRSHGLLVTQRPGRGRGRGNPSNRPYDLFRHRKQNTSRPPSMHVDDFLAADEQQQQIEENTYFKPPAPLPLTTAPRRTSQPSFKREFMPRGRGSRGGSSRNGSTTSRGSFSRFGSTNCLQGKIKSKSPSSSGNGRISRIPDRFRGPDNTTRITSRLSFSPREGYKTNKTQNPPWGISRNFSPGSARGRGFMKTRGRGKHSRSITH
uniref:Virilizer N-terminal domain-containing protein n=1 Tax=Ciona savignyi TaxID=51511 RepID=H2YDV3_CIOSA